MVEAVVIRLEVQEEPADGAITPAVEGTSGDWTRTTRVVRQHETVRVQ
jgi:hypothetical protein